MKRIDFSLAIIKLLNMMVEEGERPLPDYLKRSSEEQNRLFKAGLSKCDGYRKLSQHQFGMALDIYFLDDKGRAFYPEDKGGDAIPPKKGWDYWHKKWIELGGDAPISWDLAHFGMDK